MASRDPAFQWETEMLRSSKRPTRPDDGPTRAMESVSGEWLTVKEASHATGVPASTIRKWARHDNIPSFLERTQDGYLRMVSMRGIERWTAEIGREIDIEEPEAAINLTAENATPEGSMLVPLDAWNRMLNQLGNLHEAGQQLAEARERAAKAETEAHFLKERLADLRSELEESRHPSPEPTHESEPPTRLQSSPTSMARSIYRSWRVRRQSRG